MTLFYQRMKFQIVSISKLKDVARKKFNGKLLKHNCTKNKGDRFKDLVCCTSPQSILSVFEELS